MAIKFEFHSTRFFQLEHEYHMYKCLESDVLGVLEVKWFGSDGQSRILVMQLLGPSLETIFQSCHQRYTLNTVLIIADQLVSRLTQPFMDDGSLRIFFLHQFSSRVWNIYMLNTSFIGT